jgi:Phage major capsid protein E
VPEISLLEPVVLRGVVEKLAVPETLTLLSRFDRSPWPYPTATWDVIKGSRMVARPNVPNSEAHIVNRLGRSQESASFVYLREKKVFEPTTLHWIRTPGELAARNAERTVMREITDLNRRFDNFAELLLWRALTGRIALRYADVQADVDYRMPDSHRVTPAVPWSDATPQQIVHDIRCWKRLVQRDSQVPIREAYGTECTISAIFDSFASRATTNGSLVLQMGGALLTDRMKDQYYQTGTLPAFMGLTWQMIESVYDDDSGTPQNFVPDDVLFMGNYTDQRPIELLEGPTADLEAPTNFTGKYAKSWFDKDPSARQYLLEWSLLPIITRPEQMLMACDIGGCEPCNTEVGCEDFEMDDMPGAVN